MNGESNGYIGLQNLTELNADLLNTPYISCDTIVATTGNITTGNITTINSTNINTTNADIDNLTLPTLTASKLIRTNGANLIVSSTYDEIDFARLSADNIFTGTTNTFNNAINLPARTASKLLLTDGSKNVVSSTLNDTDLPTLAGSNTFTGTTNTFNNAINLPARTASKLLLTDGSKNVVSSTLNDTDLAPKNDPTFTTKITTPDIVLNNARVSLGSTQTTTGLTTGCLIGSNLSNGGFNNVGMINSTGTLITAGGANRFYVSQLRNAQLNAGVLLYDNTTKEVSYSATLPTLTTSGLTISGLTASRAVVSDATKALTSTTFNLPSTSGTNGFLLITDGTATTSWSDPLSLPISTLTQSALNDKAPINDPTFTTKITTPDIVLNNDRVSLGTSQTTTGLNTGILLGRSLSNNSFDNVIMLNASGTLYSANGASRFFVNPIRNVALTSGVLLYDASTKEVGYSVSPTLTSITSGSATITGLTASRAVLTDGSDNLVSATFNLPTNSGTSSFILTTNGVSSTNWADPVGLPISSATQTALNQKAPLASPTFTGIATFPDIVLNNTRISLGSSQTTTGLTTGVMIGSNLSNNLFINNIMLNGTGTLITSGGASRLYIAPIRNIGLTSGALLYDASTKEVSYSATPTLTSITAGSATITGLSANRAVLTDINDALTTTTFNLPTTSGTSGFVLRTDGVATTSWVDLATQSAVSSKAPLASPTFTGQVVVPKGSVSSPSIAFGSTDLNTGIYSPFDDTFAVALNGVQKLVMTTTTFEPKDVIKAITGTNTAPCFTFQADANAGLYQSAVNNIDIAVNQVNKVNITQTLFHSKNNIQMTASSTDTYLTHGSGNTLFKTSGLSGKYITSNIYAGAQTDTWSVLETNADGETAAFCQNGDTTIIVNPADADALWFQDEDNMTTATNYAWVGWKITLAGVLVASSDRRLKRDINKIEKENLLDNLLDVNIVKYKMKPPSEDKLYKNGVLRKKYQQEHMGVIGQNVKKNFPDVIEEQDNGDEEKFISVKYQDLSYYFHLGTQELIRKVQVLEEENKTLRTEIDKIKIFLNIQ